MKMHIVEKIHTDCF